MTSRANPRGNVLRGRWRLDEFIGSGACAKVYGVTDLKASSNGDKESWVAKVCEVPQGLPPAIAKGKKRKKTEGEKNADMLYYEYTLYNGFLRPHGGVAKVPPGGYGDDQGRRFMVMTRLGPDLSVAHAQTGPWSVSCIAGYSRQMLSLIRTLHERCRMVFVDVKPENFMMGLPGSPQESKIFLADFGLSERFTGAGGVHKPQRQGNQPVGTPEFLSLSCHRGGNAGRCDDLESLGYVIISFLRGGASPLPWSNARSNAEGLHTKESTSLESLCSGLPPAMLQFMQAARDTPYEEEPDYDALDCYLKTMVKSAGQGHAKGQGKMGLVRGEG
ncbi:unnamed protein product, partial [Discosporangium mesarthrocarpum]